MDRVSQIAFGFNLEVFKEPRGLLRVILFILSIFAFATTVDPDVNCSFTVKCNNSAATTKYEYSYSYPFLLKDVKVDYVKCDGSGTESIPLCCNLNSGPQFFVFVGVMAFLFTLASVVVYALFDDMWKRTELAPIADCGITALFAVLFLIGSSVWADTLRDIKHYGHPETFAKAHIPDCSASGSATCDDYKGGNFATLNVSVIFGFLNCFVWAANVWFVFKETRFYNQSSSNVPTPQVTTPQFSPPQVPSPGNAPM